MNFDDLDARLRVYETSHDQYIPPDVFVVARLDGRGFTRLTKEVLRLEAPFDLRFHEAMAAVVEHVMGCGFKLLYGYTQSDEISLLFDPAEVAFGGKVRKYLSILAGEASGHLSVALGRVAVFDARLSLLPSAELVVDYFRWRQEDARRNFLGAYGYWEQRKRALAVILEILATNASVHRRSSNATGAACPVPSSTASTCTSRSPRSACGSCAPDPENQSGS